MLSTKRIDRIKVMYNEHYNVHGKGMGGIYNHTKMWTRVYGKGDKVHHLKLDDLMKELSMFSFDDERLTEETLFRRIGNRILHVPLYPHIRWVE